MSVGRLVRHLQPSVCVICALAFIIVGNTPAHSAGPPSPDNRALIAKYNSLRTELAKNQFGIPLYLRSNNDSGEQRAELYGIFQYPFASIREALRTPAGWCDIVSLHLNIKACTYYRKDDRWLLALYMGRKYYQPPEDADQVDFDFHAAVRLDDYFEITLSSGNGPFYTEDYRIMLEAAPLDATGTFVHFSYSYRYGFFSSLAAEGYFATIGRDKTGFSITGSDKNGNPVYAGGIRGALERNAVRYYFALQAYMDTLDIPGKGRLRKRLGRWFDLTARFPRQLYEMSRDEYIADKEREHDNQIALQKNGGERGRFTGMSSAAPARRLLPP